LRQGVVISKSLDLIAILQDVLVEFVRDFVELQFRAKLLASAVWLVFRSQFF
jgi:hypothetical protein